MISEVIVDHAAVAGRGSPGSETNQRHDYNFNFQCSAASKSHMPVKRLHGAPEHKCPGLGAVHDARSAQVG